MSLGPDNSPTFFSARKPESNVTSMGVGSSPGYTRVVNHPFRYFVAAGESLRKIEQVMADARNVDANLLALAAEVGAELKGNYFLFKDAEVETVPSRMRLRYRPDDIFVCDCSSPGQFYPDPYFGRGEDAKREILKVQSQRPAEEANAYLAEKYKALSFDGTFFTFAGWESNVTSAPMAKQFRLKSNPAFLRADGDGDGFKPDLGTDEGLRIAAKLKNIIASRDARKCFLAWVESFELNISDSAVHRKTPDIEKVGDEWIIFVPVLVGGIFGVDGKGGVRTGEKEGWVIPPGAKPITVSEYFARLEKSGSLRSVAG